MLVSRGIYVAIMALCCGGAAFCAEAPAAKPANGKPATSNAATSNTATGEQLEFFEKRIRPLLVEHCYECHAAGAKEIGGGLRLDRHDKRMAGGDSGPALIPGKPQESLIVRAVRYDDDALKMPP